MLLECQKSTTTATWPLVCVRASHSLLLLSRFTVHIHVPMPQTVIPLLRGLAFDRSPQEPGPGDSFMNLETMPPSLAKPFLIAQIDICLFLFVNLQYLLIIYHIQPKCLGPTTTEKDDFDIIFIWIWIFLVLVMIGICLFVCLLLSCFLFSASRDSSTLDKHSPTKLNIEP